MMLQRILLWSVVLVLSMTGKPALAGNSFEVTANNYVRAETDFQMRGYIEKLDCFGKLVHSRKPYDVNNQVTVRANRDTLYSFGVFDLRSPVTVTLPDTGGRYQSLIGHQPGSFDLVTLRSCRKNVYRSKRRHPICISRDSDLRRP